MADGMGSAMARRKKWILKAAERFGWPGVPADAWESARELRLDAEGSVSPIGRAAWRHLCRTASPEQLVYARVWLKSLMDLRPGEGPARPLGLIIQLKAGAEADKEMKRREILTPRMKDHALKREFLDRALPRDRPGMTVEELIARWRRENGPYSSRGLVDILESWVSFGGFVRTGKGTPGDPHRYRLRPVHGR